LLGSCNRNSTIPVENGPDFYNPFAGYFTVLIGFPALYCSLLVMGIPRVVMTGCYGRQKLKKGGDSNLRNVNGPGLDEDDERAPLRREQSEPPVSRPTVATPAVPPSYFPSPVIGAPSYQEAAPSLLYAVADDEQLYNK
jgi:hypothetical protein